MGDDYKASLKALFSAGKIDKNARDSHGHTPLQRAALAHGRTKYNKKDQRYMIDSTEIIKELVIYGANLSYPVGSCNKGTHTIYFSSSFQIINKKPMISTTDFHCKTTWVAPSFGGN